MNAYLQKLLYQNKRGVQIKDKYRIRLYKKDHFGTNIMYTVQTVQPLSTLYYTADRYD